jgi:hypothetical protein
MALHSHFHQFDFNSADDELLLKDFERWAQRSNIPRRTRDILLATARDGLAGGNLDSNLDIDTRWQWFFTAAQARGVPATTLLEAAKYHDSLVTRGPTERAPSPADDAKLAAEAVAKLSRGEELSTDEHIDWFNALDRQAAANDMVSTPEAVAEALTAERQGSNPTAGASRLSELESMMSDPDSEYYTGSNRHALQAEHLNILERQQADTSQQSVEQPHDAVSASDNFSHENAGTVPDHQSGNDAAPTTQQGE